MEIGFLLLGIMAGIMSGLFGIGGGIIMVPALVALFGMDLLDANATSLAAMLLPVGVFGVINYYRAGYINLKDSLWISLGLFGGSFLGAELAVSVNVSLLSKLYAGILLYVAVGYFDIPALLKRKKVSSITDSGTQAITSHKIWQFILLGLCAGVFAGLFGKGGGLVIVPALVRIFHYDARAASATSLAALQLPVGLPSVIVYANDGHLNLIFAGLIALGILLGAFFGSKLALNLPTSIFKKIYAVFLLGVAVYMVVKYI
ncbi:MAG TPA: sulfite exporter TauE/SafE family protein [Paludibacter sp.]|nr:sulfite exporter TauE/SafE family protein [Paludibacter sp.]